MTVSKLLLFYLVISNFFVCCALCVQIYGDGDKRQDAEAGPDQDKWSDRFRLGKARLEGVPPEQWMVHQDAICERYREVYRDTWTHVPTAKCLANCSNFMIYDDHEVRDNWGDLTVDWDMNSLEFFVARCAWIVSMEYQRQLYEDVDFSSVEKIQKVLTGADEGFCLSVHNRKTLLNQTCHRHSVSALCNSLYSRSGHLKASMPSTFHWKGEFLCTWIDRHIVGIVNRTSISMWWVGLGYCF